MSQLGYLVSTYSPGGAFAWFPEGTRFAVVQDPSTKTWCIEWRTPNLGKGILLFASLAGRDHQDAIKIIDRMLRFAVPVAEL
jgi:hypothetical protein